MKLFFILLFFGTANAFNWNRCSSSIDRKRSTALWGSNFFTSSSQFSTSTGDCAMIGEKSHDEKVYFAQNFDEIKIDVARGGGDYLFALTSYSECKNINIYKYGQRAQENFEEIYSSSIENSFEKLINLKGECIN